jgi:hypothetical protein
MLIVHHASLPMDGSDDVRISQLCKTLSPVQLQRVKTHAHSFGSNDCQSMHSDLMVEI